MPASRAMQRLTGLAAFAVTVGVKALAPKSHLTRPIETGEAAACFFERDAVTIDLTLDDATAARPQHARWYVGAN